MVEVREIEKLAPPNRSKVPVKPPGHLHLPLVHQTTWTNHEDTAKADSSVQLRPDKAGLNRLPQTDLIGQQQAPFFLLDHLEYGLELVNPEQRSGRAEAVDHIAEVAGELEKGEPPCDCVRVAEWCVRHPGNRVLDIASEAAQVTLSAPFFAIVESHLVVNS